MFRGTVAWIATHFPPKAAADKILPWLTLVLGALGGFWAVYEYSNDVGTARIRTVLDLDRRFADEMKVDLANISSAQMLQSHRILELRCEFLKEKIASRVLVEVRPLPKECKNISGEDRASLSLLNSQLPTEFRRELRSRMNAMLASEFPLGAKEAIAVENLFRFFRAVYICVDRKNCDSATAVAIFAKDITSVLNYVCPHENSLSGSGRQETMFLAGFLLENDVDKDIFWSDDKGRESLFSCDYLRN